MADVAAFEREGRAQREVIRPDGAGFVAGGQLEGQDVYKRQPPVNMGKPMQQKLLCRCSWLDIYNHEA